MNQNLPTLFVMPKAFKVEPRGMMSTKIIAKIPHHKYNAISGSYVVPRMTSTARWFMDKINLFECVPDKGTVLQELARHTESIRVTEKPIPPQWKPVLEPMPVQWEAYKRWNNPWLALMMDCGLGKSKTLADIFAMKVYDNQVEQLLVITKSTLLVNIKSELAKHCPLKLDIHILDTSSASGKRAFLSWVSTPAEGYRVLVASLFGFQTMKKTGKLIDRGSTYDHCEIFAKMRKTFMAMDESQYIQTPGKNRTDNIMHLSNEHSVGAMIMTGTPRGVGLEKMWSQYGFMNPDIIGVNSITQFKDRYCSFGAGFQGKRVVTGSVNQQEFYDLVAPYTFVATKKDWASGLPDKTYQVRTITMSKEQKDIYARAKKESIVVLETPDISEEIKLETASALLMFLRQVSGGYVLRKQYNLIIDHEGNHKEDVQDLVVEIVPPEKNPKLQELVEFLRDDLPSDSKCVIWAFFRSEQKAIVNHLNGVFGTGSTVHIQSKKDDNRDATVQAAPFTDGDARFLVSNPEVAGVGLTLNQAAYTVYFSNHASPGMRVQSEDRNHRIGQKNPVLYVDLICTGSRDPHTYNRLMAHIKDENDFKQAMVNHDFTETAARRDSDRAQLLEVIRGGSLKDYINSL